MAKSIITQNDEIINYENVVSIHVDSKEKYGQSNKEIFIFQELF